MSVVVMEGISRTTLPLAEAMVAAGQAKPDDFWVLCGYAGWGPGQLQMEIDERKSWHVAAASVKVVNELMDSATSAETLAAGVPEWEELMSRIGMRAEALASQGGLADKMLREYARVHLGPAPETGEDMVASLMQAALRRQGREDTEVGTPEGTVVVSALPTPFALNQQFLHKAVVLVIDDSDQATAGAILNRPTARTAQFMSAPPAPPAALAARAAHPRCAGPRRLRRCARPGWARCLLGTPRGAWASAASTARVLKSSGFTPLRHSRTKTSPPRPTPRPPPAACVPRPTARSLPQHCSPAGQAPLRWGAGRAEAGPWWC